MKGSRAETIARKLVPEGTVNREAKVKAQSRGDEKAPDVDREEAREVAAMFLDAMKDELRYDLRMASSYRKFFIWLIYGISLLMVIAMQRKVNNFDVRQQYRSLHDTYFGLVANVTRDASREEGELTQNFAAISTHLRDTVLPTVFKGDACGNDICEAAWGEYPVWRGADDGKEFNGCLDCGIVEVKNVTVNFFDAYKFVEAEKAVRTAARVDGRTPAEWGVLDSDGILKVQPKAAWNICHKQHREQGHLTRVCVFDGDVSIDGLAYRTTELQVDSATFGTPKTVSLYEGQWELRIAFEGFVWSLEDGSASVNVAFPSIRGSLCWDDENRTEICQYWDPCPARTECKCEFIDNAQVCYDDLYWSTFNTTKMRHDVPPNDLALRDPAAAAYPEATSIEAIADWWRIPRNPFEASRYWTQRDPPPELPGKDSWSRECDNYDLLFLDPQLDTAWDDATFEIWLIDDLLPVDADQLSINAAKLAKVYNLQMNDVGCQTTTVLLCRDRHYAFSFASSGKVRSRPGEALAYQLMDSTGEILLRGNAAWTYEKFVVTGNGTSLEDFTPLGFAACPDDLYDRSSCFDANASNCLWSYGFEPRYCDPTVYNDDPLAALYGATLEKRVSIEGDVIRAFNEPGLSGSSCNVYTSCEKFLMNYAGSSSAYACEPDPPEVPQKNVTTAAPTAALNRTGVALSGTFLDRARHLACTFTTGLCGWTGNNWHTTFGTTSTPRTGPGIDGDPSLLRSFAYVESTGQNGSFVLESKNFTQLEDVAILEFSYHMYGVRMGSLSVDAQIKDINSTWIPVWIQSYNQGPQWFDVDVTLPIGTTKVRFVATVDHETSDVAIDDVIIKPHPNATYDETNDDFFSVDDVVCVDIVMANGAGNGWSGSSYEILGKGEQRRGFLETGSVDVDEVCLATGCYEIVVSDGSATEGKQFELALAETIYGMSYSVFRSPVGVRQSFSVDAASLMIDTSGCTFAPTMTPAPTVTAAPTCAMTLIVEMDDSQHDGWQGAFYDIAQTQGTLSDGGKAIDIVCLDEPGCYNFTVSEGIHPEDIHFDIFIEHTNQSRPAILTGGAPFSGSIFVDGDASSGSLNSCTGDEAPEPTQLNTFAPTPSPKDIVRCYSNWRQVIGDSDEENFWEQPALTEIVECPLGETGCVAVEYEWPPSSMINYFVNTNAYPYREEEPQTYLGLLGCKSSFPEIQGYTDCVDQGWFAFSPPSQCFSCDGDLCNNGTSGGYVNIFNVPHVALYHSMDWVLSGETASSTITFLSPSRTCEPSHYNDGECDFESNILGCGYDGGDCQEDPRTANSAPWFQKASWRYAIADGDDNALPSVPFTLHEAVTDKLRLHVLGNPDDYPDVETWSIYNATYDRLYDGGRRAELMREYFPQDINERNETSRTFEDLLNVMMPSLACPECAPSQDEEGYRAVNFTVETNDHLAERMFREPSDDELRIRYLAQPNIVLYGILLTQTRASLRTCPTRKELRRDQFVDVLRSNLNQSCIYVQRRLAKASRSEVDPFEEEASFVRESKDAFGVDPTFVETSDLYRVENDVENYYEHEDVRKDTGIPYGFQYRMGAPEREYHTIEGDRSRYPMNYPVFIPTQGNASRAYEILDFLEAGGYFNDAGTDDITVQILSFNPETENFALITSTYDGLPTGAVAADHEIVVYDVTYYESNLDLVRFAVEILALTLFVWLVAIQIFEIRLVFQRTGSLVGVLCDFSYVVDFFGYAFQLALVPAWVRVIQRCQKFRPRATYDVHNILEIGRLVQAQSETHQAQFIIDSFGAIRDAFQSYELYATLALIGLALQSLKALRFHPTFGLISATIVNMSAKVAFWFILLVLVVSCYAVLGTILFSRENDDYASWEVTAITLLAALSGMYDYTGLDLEDLQAQLFLWTYMFLAFFVLLNVLLAIIVEGYEASRSHQAKRDPLMFFARAFLGATKAGSCLVPAHTLLSILNVSTAVLRTSPEEVKDNINDDTSDPDDHPDDTYEKPKLLSWFSKKTVYGNVDEWIVKHMEAATARYRSDDIEELRRFAYNWKPAADEALVAIDLAVLAVALRLISPTISVEMWHVVAVNLIARYGEDRDFDEDEETDQGHHDAIKRLLEVHRLVDLDGIDAATLFAAVYNYLQDRPDSLLSLVDAADEPPLPAAGAPQLRRRAKLVNDISAALQNSQLDPTALAAIQTNLTLLAKENLDDDVTLDDDKIRLADCSDV